MTAWTAPRLGCDDILLVTLDTLRYDVAQDCFAAGRTPCLGSRLPPAGWEPRHTPGSFTWAAHQAFFAGFLPTPLAPGKHPRPLALAFPGSETITGETCVLDAPDVVTGLADHGYHTLCAGGVGFFNQRTPLARVLPGLFAESAWRPEFGVTERDSTRHQVAWLCERLAALPASRRVFVFLNVSAIHQPNCHYLPGATTDTLESHAAALAYVDAQLPPLFDALARRGPGWGVVCSDHGTAYGEEGYHGHRLAHPVVWTVPYLEFVWPACPPRPSAP